MKPSYQPRQPRIPDEIQTIIDYLRATEETLHGQLEVTWATRQKLLQYYGAPIEDNPTPQDSEKIHNLKMLFPAELEQMLYFNDKGTYVEIKPRQYLGSENFARVGSVVRGIGGEYISAGRDSHYKVPGAK